jgi:glycosyltransferase involved in cell wall biosynthesis
VFEPFSGGHHTKYVAILLPALARLAKAAYVERVTLTTSSAHVGSPDFADSIAPFSSFLHLDVVDGAFRSEDGNRIAGMLAASIERTRPDFVISTSANNGGFRLALQSVLSSPLRGREIGSVGIIHHGFTDRIDRPSTLARELVHRISRRFAPWSEVHVVNPLLYETIARQGFWRPGALRMLPHPVEVPAPVDKITARERLGIPATGRYVGHIGKGDGRKAVPELLAAFRAARFDGDVRLLFAGELYPAHRALIHARYDDLVAAGRIVLIDRYLHPDEFHVANCASDVVSVAYYTDALASNLLAATAAGRPVLASRHGYTGMMVRTFGVGWACDVTNPASFLAALRAAVDGSERYRGSTAQTERLLQFHDPQNFVDTLLQRLYQRLGIALPCLKTWEWAKSLLTSSSSPVHA